MELNPDLGIAILKFKDVSTRNAMTLEKSDALVQLISYFQQTSPDECELQKMLHSHEFTVLALHSSVDDVFISGGSLKEIPLFTEAESVRFTANMRIFTQFLRQSALVSVSLINGLAVGGGAEIALATDLRMSVSPKASVSLAQTKWGVPAGWGMMQDLKARGVYHCERRRGIALASQEVWSLSTLLRMGLIDADYSHETESAWMDKLTTLAQNLARCPSSLRSELIESRPAISETQLPEYDSELFSKYWMKDLHLKRLEGFLSSNSISKRSQ